MSQTLDALLVTLDRLRARDTVDTTFEPETFETSYQNDFYVEEPRPRVVFHGVDSRGIDYYVGETDKFIPNVGDGWTDANGLDYVVTRLDNVFSDGGATLFIEARVEPTSYCSFTSRRLLLTNK